MNNEMKLMDQLAAPENLLAAWRTVRGNIPGYRRERSAGPDGMSITEFERDLPAQLSALRHMLMKGRYQPQAPGLFTIKKRSGGTRQIALLNVMDRVAKRAAQQVIEPLYEPAFLPCSFGFRPGRSIHDAVYCARRLRSVGFGWVVDGDIAACFDSLDHELLLQKVSKRISDGRVVDLLKSWLGIGVLEHGLPAEKPGWLSQGWEKASSGLRQGFDWTLNTLDQNNQPDPYLDVRGVRPYAPKKQAQVPGGTIEEAVPAEEAGADDFQPYQPGLAFERSSLQKRAFQQIAASGLILGSGWARQYLPVIGKAAVASLKSSAGREILKRGLLIGGGTLGAAAGVAASAYFLYRQVGPSTAGILQGSPLSPLLANIYLHSFDISMTRSGFRLVRFADDWVILCADQEHAESAYNQSVLALANIHLKVNAEKTHILPPAAQLEWLGEVIS